MRKALKFLHTAASAGIVGALLGYIVILAYTPQGTPVAYADMRATISALCDYLLLPSLAVALVTGLLSMAAHQPFQEMRWVWVKALLGLLMFEATLAIINAKATTAAALSKKIAAGEAETGALQAALSTEWHSLGALIACRSPILRSACGARDQLGVARSMSSRIPKPQLR